MNNFPKLSLPVAFLWLSLAVRDHLALTGEAGYMRMSCAGIHHPNLGANNVVFMIGATWFFGS